MNVSDITGMIAELDVEIADAEMAEDGAELLTVLREERAALVEEGLALEESEAEEAAALDRANQRAFVMALEAEERRTVERMEAAYPDGLCPYAPDPGPCPLYGPESDACCRLA